jgi:hypothetical protein
MKCWNSAFNAKESKYSSCAGRSSENIRSSSAGAQALKKKKHRMKLSLPPKLVEKLVWVLVISLGKIFIPRYAFDGLLCWTWPFSPPNRLTLWITVFYRFHDPAFGFGKNMKTAWVWQQRYNKTLPHLINEPKHHTEQYCPCKHTKTAIGVLEHMFVCNNLEDFLE